MVFTFPSCRYVKQRLGLGEYSVKAAMKWAKQDSIRIADSLTKVMESKQDFERTLTDSLMSIEDKTPAESDHYFQYYIIIGSFANHENAEQAAGKYSQRGYKTNILTVARQNGIKTELVSIKTFRDRNEAGIFLKDFQSRLDPHAWLYTGKPN